MKLKYFIGWNGYYKKLEKLGAVNTWKIGEIRCSEYYKSMRCFIIEMTNNFRELV